MQQLIYLLFSFSYINQKIESRLKMSQTIQAKGNIKDFTKVNSNNISCIGYKEL